MRSRQRADGCTQSVGARHAMRKAVVETCFACDYNRFIQVCEYAGSTYTLFMTKPPVSRRTMRVGAADQFGGLCKYRIIRDARMLIGFLFSSRTEFTRVSPVSLVVTYGSDNSEYRELPMPPKIGILTFMSQNSSVVVVPSEGLELPYVVTGDQ